MSHPLEDWLDLHLVDHLTSDRARSIVATLAGIAAAQVAVVVDHEVIGEPTLDAALVSVHVDALDAVDALDPPDGAPRVDESLGYVCMVRVVGPTRPDTMTDRSQRFVDLADTAGVGAPADDDEAPGEFDVFIANRSPIRIDADAWGVTNSNPVGQTAAAVDRVLGKSFVIPSDPNERGRAVERRAYQGAGLVVRFDHGIAVEASPY